MRTFREFYAFYLSEHRDPTCRKLHFAGSLLVLVIVAAALTTGEWQLLWLAPLAGYGFAWLGHFAFEKNKPATFRAPVRSFLCDWVMFAQLLTGRIPFDERHPRPRSGTDPA